jgi:hypothetical protein
MKKAQKRKDHDKVPGAHRKLWRESVVAMMQIGRDNDRAEKE